MEYSFNLKQYLPYNPIEDRILWGFSLGGKFILKFVT